MAEIRLFALLAVMIPVLAGMPGSGAASAQGESDGVPMQAYGRIIPAGPVLRFDTTEGTFRVMLFGAHAPRLVRAFLESVSAGAFRQEGFWLARAEGIQLGSPMTDVSDGGSRDVRSGSPGSRPLRDSASIPFLATMGAHGFDGTSLRPIAGSVMVDSRFIVGGQLLRREYFVARGAGFRRGEVIGHVISGMATVRRLDSRDGILAVRVE